MPQTFLKTRSKFHRMNPLGQATQLFPWFPRVASGETIQEHENTTRQRSGCFKAPCTSHLYIHRSSSLKIAFVFLFKTCPLVRCHRLENFSVPETPLAQPYHLVAWSPSICHFFLSPSTKWNLNTTKWKTGILIFPTIKKTSSSSSTFELSDTLHDADHREKHTFTISIIPWDWLLEVKSLWQESHKHVTPNEAEIPQKFEHCL